VAEQLSPIAKPDEIRFTDNLPKTRSGKIMRRLLRSIARGEEITQDVSTLENPAILDQLRGAPAATAVDSSKNGSRKKTAPAKKKRTVVPKKKVSARKVGTKKTGTKKAVAKKAAPPKRGLRGTQLSGKAAPAARKRGAKASKRHPRAKK
jgi:hypothetical protein